MAAVRSIHIIFVGHAVPFVQRRANYRWAVLLYLPAVHLGAGGDALAGIALHKISIVKYSLFR